MIEAKGLRARIGASEVLKGVDAAVANGQMLAVIGANGAGKTSLLRALSNVLPLEAGEIIFDGQPTRGTACMRWHGAAWCTSSRAGKSFPASLFGTTCSSAHTISG